MISDIGTWVVTTGSRKWTNWDQIEQTLRFLKAKYPDLQIVNGKSRGLGADWIVEQLCAPDHLNIPFWPVRVRGDLDGHHQGAPLNRNKRMLTSYMPILVVAFRASGKSNGTDQTIAVAKAMNIPVEIHTEQT